MMPEKKRKMQWFEQLVSVEEYREKCVDVQEFLPYCKACNLYGKVWSCPPYAFSPDDYWKKYREFLIVGLKVCVPEELLSGTYTPEEREEILSQILMPEKERLDAVLLEREKEVPGSISLSGGSCQKCLPKECTRRHHQPCRHPDTLRYSIESLGGNVGLTVTKYLHQELQWMEEGKLPEYFILVGGLLLP